MKPLLSFLALVSVGVVFLFAQTGCTTGYSGYSYGYRPVPVPVPVYRPPARYGYYGGGYYHGYRGYNGYRGYGYRGGGSGSYHGYRGGSASWGGGSGSWSGPRGGSGNWHR